MIDQPDFFTFVVETDINAEHFFLFHIPCLLFERKKKSTLILFLFFADFGRQTNEPLFLGPPLRHAAHLHVAGHPTKGIVGLFDTRPRHPDPALHPVEVTVEQSPHPVESGRAALH